MSIGKKHLPGIVPRLGVAIVALGAVTGIGACGSGGGSDSVDLVAYSTPQQVYEDKLEPDFQKTDAGDGVARLRC